MTQRNQTLRTARGFTLIELLVTMVVFGIMLSLAAPSLAGYLNQNRTRRALDEVASDIAYARATAVRIGRGATVEFLSSTEYRIVMQTGSGTEVAKRVDLGRDYPGVTITFTAANLAFDSRGILSGGGTESEVVARGMDGNTHSLVISAVGQVYRDY